MPKSALYANRQYQLYIAKIFNFRQKSLVNREKSTFSNKIETFSKSFKAHGTHERDKNNRARQTDGASSKQRKASRDRAEHNGARYFVPVMIVVRCWIIRRLCWPLMPHHVVRVEWLLCILFCVVLLLLILLLHLRQNPRLFCPMCISFPSQSSIPFVLLKINVPPLIPLLPGIWLLVILVHHSNLMIPLYLYSNGFRIPPSNPDNHQPSTTLLASSHTKSLCTSSAYSRSPLNAYAGFHVLCLAGCRRLGG
jgi:hypothetical protein